MNKQTTIQSVCPTLCSLLSAPIPGLCSTDILPQLRQPTVEKALVFLPDAIGNQIWDFKPEWLQQVMQIAPLSIELKSVFPPKTPVCFASMFTGALPEVHGIRQYAKPVITIDSLFDSLIRAGKRVALVAVQDSSMDIIFRQRDMAYFSLPYDKEVEEKAIELMQSDEYDVIIAYQQAYDDCLHKYGVFAPPSIAAAHSHIQSFVRLAEVFHSTWKDYSRVLLFAPDHGAHDADGTGTHGDDIPEDMELKHFWSVSP